MKLLTSIVFCLLLTVPALGEECSTGNTYALGSSFLWDAQPIRLDNNPEWHIFCAKSLDYIYNNPFDHCLASSVPWPTTLEPPVVNYDYIVFQTVPALGSTQDQDVMHISGWIEKQRPCTTGIIHHNWPAPADWETEFHQDHPDNTFTNHSRTYAYSLRTRLRIELPGRNFILTHTNEMMDDIFHDPDAPIAFADLFRDGSGHMSGIGRYLQHNALRYAVGQPIGVDVSEGGLDPAIKAYLDTVIVRYGAAKRGNRFFLKRKRPSSRPGRVGIL